MTKGHKQLDRDGLFSPAFLAAVREALPTLEKLIDAYRDQHRNESDRTRFSVPTNRSVVPGPASQVFLCVITGHQRRVEKVAMTREQKDRLAHDDLDFLYDDTTRETRIRMPDGKVKPFQDRKSVV